MSLITKSLWFSTNSSMFFHPWVFLSVIWFGKLSYMPSIPLSHTGIVPPSCTFLCSIEFSCIIKFLKVLSVVFIHSGWYFHLRPFLFAQMVCFMRVKSLPNTLHYLDSISSLFSSSLIVSLLRSHYGLLREFWQFLSFFLVFKFLWFTVSVLQFTECTRLEYTLKPRLVEWAQNP